MNYVELSTAIQQTIENYEPSFVANIPNFVRRAEQYIYNAVQMPAARQNQVGATTPAEPYLEAPNGFLAVNALSIRDVNGITQFLKPKDVEFVREAFPDPTDMGPPRYYAIFDNNTFILGPTPDDAYPVEIHFYGYPPSIVVAGNSWIGDNYDSALLYGALVEAAVYTKAEQEVLKGYTDQFAVALTGLKRLVDGMDRTDTYRNNQYRAKVS